MGHKKSSHSRYTRALEEIERTLARRTDPIEWISANLQIRTKSRQILPLHPNAMQLHYYRHRTHRDVILKGRQLGCSTICCALLFAETVLQPNVQAAIIAHDFASSKRLFQITHRFWELLPEPERTEIGKPRIDSQEELFWPALNSRIVVGTAGSRSFGRSLTFDAVLCSEYARWPEPEAALISITEAVPASGRIIVESTPEGMGNPFHQLWVESKAGENGYRAHFYPWWFDADYRLPGPPLEDVTEEEAQLLRAPGLDADQIRWRRAKIRELRSVFGQEYPEDDVTCFLASGRCVFDVSSLTAMQRRIATESPPAEIASLTSKKGTVSIAPARLLMWQSPVPKRSYLIGADVGGGGAYGDASAAVVLDYETGEQVAGLHGRVAPERFAHLLDALGRYYNDAELAVERNNHGHSTWNTLFHTCGYSNLYRHADYNNPQGHHGQLGWPTDARTKPLMIDTLAAAIAEGAIGIHCSEIVDECFTYTVTDSGGTEAQAGHHDDWVVALAIAWQLRQRPKPMVQIARAGPRPTKGRATPADGPLEPRVHEFMGTRYRLKDSRPRPRTYLNGRPWP